MQKPKHKRKQSSVGITIRTLPSGQVRYQVYLGRDAEGKQKFKLFTDRSEAVAYLEKLGIAKANEGQQLWSLTPDQRGEAARCYKLLLPYPEATLTAAVTNYIGHVLKYRSAPNIKELVKEHLQEVKSANRRQRTIEDLQHRLGKFADAFGSRKLSSITVPELRTHIEDPAHSAQTQINSLTKLSQLYNFAKRHGYISENLIDRIKRPTPSDDEGEPEVFTVKEAAQLLENAVKFELVPYIAIGLFAGLRVTELERLDWSAIKYNEHCIVVGKGIAKKRSRRIVDISDNLAEWIAPYVKESGEIAGENLRKRRDALIKVANITWKANGLRHSFGSYHLARFHDTAKTAFQMGHHDPAIVHDNYKVLVDPIAAEKYWNLRPDGVAEGKVVPMRQAG